tara:strand:+ start:497 stop:913 length:417 start_codon:yes stop_codon:yes gene_type:complete
MSLQRTLSAIRINGYGLVDANIANIVLIAADNMGCPKSEAERQVCMQSILVAMRAAGFPKLIRPRTGAIATVSMPEKDWIKWETWAQTATPAEQGGAGRHATRIKKSRKKKRTKRRRKSRKRKSRKSRKSRRNKLRRQ